jgi:hypothetical protein
MQVCCRRNGGVTSPPFFLRRDRGAKLACLEKAASKEGRSGEAFETKRGVVEQGTDELL